MLSSTGVLLKMISLRRYGAWNISIGFYGDARAERGIIDADNDFREE